MIEKLRNLEKTKKIFELSHEVRNLTCKFCKKRHALPRTA